MNREERSERRVSEAFSLSRFGLFIYNLNSTSYALIIYDLVPVIARKLLQGSIMSANPTPCDGMNVLTDMVDRSSGMRLRGELGRRKAIKDEASRVFRMMVDVERESGAIIVKVDEEVRINRPRRPCCKHHKSRNGG